MQNNYAESSSIAAKSFDSMNRASDKIILMDQQNYFHLDKFICI